MLNAHYLFLIKRLCEDFYQKIKDGWSLQTQQYFRILLSLGKFEKLLIRKIIVFCSELQTFRTYFVDWFHTFDKKIVLEKFEKIKPSMGQVMFDENLRIWKMCWQYYRWVLRVLHPERGKKVMLRSVQPSGRVFFRRH